MIEKYVKEQYGSWKNYYTKIGKDNNLKRTINRKIESINMLIKPLGLEVTVKKIE